jgi:hypothetical protein
VAAAAAILAAILAGLEMVIALIAAGTETLVGALALIFGLTAAQTATAAAIEKAKQESAGLLDKTLGWFKSWFN